MSSRAGVGVGAAAAATAYVLRLTHRLRQLHPDLVHCNTLKANLYGPPAARAAGIPVVWHARDRVEPDYLPPRLVPVVRAVAARLPDVVLANSAATLASLHLPPGRMAHVVPSPVSEAPQRGERAGGPLVVVAVGRLAPWKGQHVAIDAFARAFPTGQEQLRIVGSALFGEDDYAASLERRVAEHGLTGRVVFTGHVDDVGAELQAADVLVHSSTIPEPFGNVVVEGMAAGLAVVASDAGGPREVVTHGQDGLLTPLGDVAALADTLRELANNAPLRRELGVNARDTAQTYSPERVAQQVFAIYLAALRPRAEA